MIDAEDKRKCYLLAHFLRCPDIMAEAGETAETYNLFEDPAACSMIWDVAWKWFGEYGTLPPRHALEIGVEAEYEKERRPFDLGGLKNTIHVAYSLDESQLNRQYVGRELHAWVVDRVRDTLPGVSGSIDPKEFHSRMLEHLRPTGTDLLSTKRQAKAGGKTLVTRLRTAAKRPLLVPFLDEMTGGGVPPGSFVGVIMPSGQGKTTLALQLGAEAVAARKHILHFSFEQCLDGDITLRIMCLTSGCPRKRLEAYAKALAEGEATESDEDMEAAMGVVHHQAFLERTPMWERYMHFEDWSDPDAGVSSVHTLLNRISEVRREIQANDPDEDIYLVNIDWWGPLKNKLIASTPGARSDSDKMRVAQTALHHLKTGAQSLGIPIVLYHQVAGAAAGKSSRSLPSSHNAQGDTNFNNFADFCFVSGRLDAGGVLRFALDKGRMAQACERELWLEGDKCRFHARDDSVGSDASAPALLDLSIG